MDKGRSWQAKSEQRRVDQRAMGGIVLGILSRLFAKKTANSSYVRRWLTREEIEADREKADAFALFVDLMDTACRFGQADPGDEQAFPAEVADRYAGDATVFEVACYTFSRLRAWLAVSHPAVEKTVVEQLAFWLAEIFAVAWHQAEQQVNSRLAERLDSYRALAKDGDPAIRGEVVRRVLATRGNRFAKGDDLQVAEADRRFAEYSLEVYEKNQLPALLAAAADYCAGQEAAQRPADREKQAGQEVRDYRLAMALLAQKDFLRAKNAFAKVLAADPDNYDALVERGRLQVSLSQPVEAIEDFSRAIAVRPGDSRAYLERGLCYHRVLRQADRSLADFDKAIELAPDDAVGHFARGALFDEVAGTIERQAEESGEREIAAEPSAEYMAAVNGYSRAIELAPGFGEAYVGRGLAYARRARAGGVADYAARAVADLEKAMELNWENGYLYKTVEELRDLLAERQPANV